MGGGTAPRPVDRRFPLALVLAIGAYLLLRGLVLHTAFDEVALWMYEVNPMGTLAEMFLRGIRVPPYLFYDNAAGQVLAGYLTVPAFLVLGPTYLALKIVPLLMGVGTLCLVHALLERSFGRTAAALGAFLVVLAPTTFFKYSVVCSGNHFENVFFTSIVLYLFYRFHEEGEGIPARKLALLGAAAGFAIFVFLGAVIPVGILALMHACIRGPRRFLRDLAPLAPGFLAGLSPLLLLNAWTRGRGASYLAAKFGEGEAVGASALARVPGRMAQFLAQKLPKAPDYPSVLGIRGSTLGWIFTAALVVALLVAISAMVRGPRGEAASRFERWKLAPMVLCLPLYALAFGLSNLVVYELGGPLSFSAYRYFLPVFLFGILALAAVCARGFERGGGARAGATVLFAAALLPGLSNLAIVDWSFSHTGLGARYDGYDLSKIARALVSTKNRLSQAEILRFLEEFPPLLRARVARALGFNLAVLKILQQNGRDAASIREGRLDLEALVAPYPDRDRAEISFGAGIAARFQQFSSGASLADLLGFLARTGSGTPEASKALLRPFVEGVATPNPILPLATRTATILEETGTLAARALEDSSAREIARGVARGEGFLCGGLLRRGIPLDVRCVSGAMERLPAELAADFFHGLGAGCAEGGERPGLPSGSGIPAAGRLEFWSGFAERLQAIHGEDARKVLAGIEERWTAEQRAGFERAISGL